MQSDTDKHSLGGSCALTSDIIGVIAGFLPPTTSSQKSLMLVSSVWYRGVVEQDGMLPKPKVHWPWSALQERQPRRVRLPDVTRGRSKDSSPSFELDKLSCTLPNLEGLTAPFCPFSDDDLLYVATHFPKLTHLDISNSHQVTDRGIEHVCRHLGGQLQHLILCGNDKMTFNCLRVEFAEHMKSLTTLEVDDCADVAEGGKEVHVDGVSEMFHFLKSIETLKKVKLDELGVQQSVDKSTPLPILRSITELSVEEEPLSSDGLHNVCTSMPHLESLSFKLGRLASLIPLPQLTQLTHLDVRCLFHRADISPVAALSRLEHLCLRGWVDLSVNVLEKIATNLHKLQHLELHLCPIDNVQPIVSMPTLRTLVFVDCKTVTDADLKNIGDAGCNLETLQITWSPEITDDGVQELAKALGGNEGKLTDLKLCNCNGLTDTALTHICDYMPKLLKLDISGCRFVTDVGVQQVAEKLPQLRQLHLAKIPLTFRSFLRIQEKMKYLECLSLGMFGASATSAEEVEALLEKSY